MAGWVGSPPAPPRPAPKLIVSRPPGHKLLGDALALAASIGISWLALMYIKRKLDPYREEKKQGKAGKKASEAKKKHPKLQIVGMEQVIICGAVSPEELDTTLDDVGGLESVKAELETSLLDPLAHPHLYTSHLLQPAKGILLYGAPGTGKTMLAKALAREASAYFLLIRPSMLTSKWYGDSQRLCSAIFSLALKLAPCIIFLDEVDSLLGLRKDSDHEATVGIKNEFMQLWDGFHSRAEYGVVVLGATNRREAIDPAALRRFTVQADVGPPDQKARLSIMRMNLEKHALSEAHRVAPDLIKVMAAATQGLSGSDLKELCVRAARLQISEFQQLCGEASIASRAVESISIPVLEQRHMRKALNDLQPLLDSRKISSRAQTGAHTGPSQLHQLYGMIQMLQQQQQQQQHRHQPHQQQPNGLNGASHQPRSREEAESPQEDVSSRVEHPAQGGDAGEHSGQDAPVNGLKRQDTGKPDCNGSS